VAQHININNYSQKRFKTIEKGIRKAFLNSYIRGSLKYIFNEALTNSYGYKNIDVYITSYYIGKGFVWFTDRGNFEIHFNFKTKVVENIYLVA